MIDDSDEEGDQDDEGGEYSGGEDLNAEFVGVTSSRSLAAGKV